jgi:hypothetical protein
MDDLSVDLTFRAMESEPQKSVFHIEVHAHGAIFVGEISGKFRRVKAIHCIDHRDRFYGVFRH